MLVDIKKWQEKGLLRKLYNFVVFISRSVQQEQHFWTVSSGLRLVHDNKTRWNSWFNILERALNLWSSIDLYYKAYLDNEYKGDILTDGE